MKSSTTIFVLLALLATASILFAERKPSTAPASGARPAAAVSNSWVCPMWAWFNGSPATANAPAAQGPAMMYGRQRQYGSMGPAMMDGPAPQQDQAGVPTPTNNNSRNDSKPPAH